MLHLCGYIWCHIIVYTLKFHCKTFVTLNLSDFSIINIASYQKYFKDTILKSILRIEIPPNTKKL